MAVQIACKMNVLNAVASSLKMFQNGLKMSFIETTYRVNLNMDI